jgi:hypothetical protein
MRLGTYFGTKGIILERKEYCTLYKSSLWVHTSVPIGQASCRSRGCGGAVGPEICFLGETNVSASWTTVLLALGGWEQSSQSTRTLLSRAQGTGGWLPLQHCARLIAIGIPTKRSRRVYCIVMLPDHHTTYQVRAHDLPTFLPPEGRTA